MFGAPSIVPVVGRGLSSPRVHYDYPLRVECRELGACSGISYATIYGAAPPFLHPAMGKFGQQAT